MSKETGPVNSQQTDNYEGRVTRRDVRAHERRGPAPGVESNVQGNYTRKENKPLLHGIQSALYILNDRKLHLLFFQPA